MKIKRKGANLRLTFGVGELRSFQALPGRLRRLIERPDMGDKITQRLFPRAADDPQLDRELRELIADDLRAKKLQHLTEVENMLAGIKGFRKHLELTPSQIEHWLMFINDMRLLLGTALDITEDGWSQKINPLFPPSEEWALMLYLSWLQTLILDQVYGISPDGGAAAATDSD